MALNPDGILQVYCIPFHLTDRTGYLVASHFGGVNLDSSESDDDANFISSVRSIDSDPNCMLSIIANTRRSLADKIYPPADADFDDDGSNTSIDSDFFQSPHGAPFRKGEYFNGNNTHLSPDTIGQSNHFWDAGSHPCADLLN
jgi:hypothetical protein